MDKTFVHTHTITYDYSPLTKVSRIVSISLSNSSGEVSPLRFDWYDGSPVVFGDTIKDLAKLSYTGDSTTTQIIPLDFNANGTTDLVITSSKKSTEDQTSKLYIDVYLSDGEGGLSSTPTSGSGSTGLDYSKTVLPMDTNGDGMTDLVRFLVQLYNSLLIELIVFVKVHILLKENDYFITVLLSNGKGGYDKQDTVKFRPEVVTGYFYPGDFEVFCHSF